MKLTIDRNALMRALSHVQAVVERRNTIPILSNILMEAEGDRLRLTATDLDIDTTGIAMLNGIIDKVSDDAINASSIAVHQEARVLIRPHVIGTRSRCLRKRSVAIDRVDVREPDVGSDPMGQRLRPLDDPAGKLSHIDVVRFEHGCASVES